MTAAEMKCAYCAENIEAGVAVCPFCEETDPGKGPWSKRLAKVGSSVNLLMLRIGQLLKKVLVPKVGIAIAGAVVLALAILGVRAYIKHHQPDPVLAGDEALRSGDRPKAIAAYQEAAKAEPTDARPWRRLGDIYWNANQKAYALYCYQAYAARAPEDKAFQSWLAKVTRK
jgi:tetratricopeptide (TPR) repeat protein